MLILLILTSFEASGCAARIAYDMQVERPHKDVARVLVHVPERLDADGYRLIAEEVSRDVLSAREDRDVPLYEVRIEFFVPSQGPCESRVAAFTWTVHSAASTSWTPETKSLVLY
ncbi:MAG TPA: hypothetical protein VMT52_17090 [Planctomycetota bacterium]|nr:hypothetical protein [Planctomycetota bacterium]